MDAIETIRNRMSARHVIRSIAHQRSGSCNAAIGPFSVPPQGIDQAAPLRDRTIITAWTNLDGMYL